MADQIPYPPGFYGETPTGAIHCFTHTKNSVPEMDFNDYVYFISENGHLNKQVIDSDILRAIVAKPVERQGLLNKMMMMSKDGVVSPAHLPNIADVVALGGVQQAIRELESEEEPEFEGITPIIPKKLASLIDPKPILPRSGPIYTIGKYFHCEFGSYTDDVVYAQVRSPVTNLSFTVFWDQFIEDDMSSRYCGIRIRSETEDGIPNLALGSSVVLWNGRRISRPSFGPHFREVVATHNPILIIVTEVGSQATNLTRTLQSLGTTLTWKFDEGKGIHGGSVIMWDAARVAATVYVADCTSSPLRVVGSVHVGVQE